MKKIIDKKMSKASLDHVAGGKSPEEIAEQRQTLADGWKESTGIED